jgi:primase-polymerase (primpol)-like protein
MNDNNGGQRNVVPRRPEKPDYLKPDFDRIPDELKRLPNWIVWRAKAPRPGKAKWRKVPYTPLKYTSRKSAEAASVRDRTTWRNFAEAVEAYEASQKWKRPFDGIGFVFDGAVDEDGLCYCGVDLDAWTDRAQAIFAKIATYTEISPSGRGAHVIARAAPFDQATCKTEEFSAEAYCAGRYFTFSGVLVEGAVTSIESRAHEIAEIVTEIEWVNERTKAETRAPTSRAASALGAHKSLLRN